ncbi:hypothetical protein ABIE33_006488 [Ensifer sp. 4252]
MGCASNLSLKTHHRGNWEPRATSITMWDAALRGVAHMIRTFAIANLA